MRAFRRLIRLLIGVCAVIGLLFLIATFTPLDFWWATAYAGPWDDPKGDVLVVLTGSLLDEKTIGLNSYWRSIYAARAFTEDGFKEMIISGGGDEPTPISAPMRDFVEFLGAPKDRVRIETSSNSTRTSALEMAKLLATSKQRIVLLTSDYHMFRAHRAFRRAGLNVEPRPIPDARKRYGSLQERWAVFLGLASETVKIGYYWSRGWL
jgi:uncharacterized SAM-binding protein YcdF (DUF218 family)